MIISHFVGFVKGNRNMMFLLVVGLVALVFLYACGVVKIGFIISAATEGTGFNAGFYMIWCMTMLLGVPFGIAAQFFT